MPTMRQIEDQKIFDTILRINSKILGLVLGLLIGSVIFIATNWLVIQGGGYPDESGHSVVGPHLQLLDQFFIGYSVSFAGSFIGFAYGFACGTMVGALIGRIYNKLVQFGHTKA